MSNSGSFTRTRHYVVVLIRLNKVPTRVTPDVIPDANAVLVTWFKDRECVVIPVQYGVLDAYGLVCDGRIDLRDFAIISKNCLLMFLSG
jgi:hypothetical protein